MRLTFSEIADTIDGAIDYLHRIRGAGTAGKLKEAIPWGLPGYFYRPNDADEDSEGTEDCLLVEQGDHRHVISTRNATAWARMLSYMDSVWTRVMDRGERVITAEDGTARAWMSWQPDGTITIRADNGVAAPGDKIMEVVLDPATGNMDVTPGGTTPGLIRLGGAGATFHLIQEETLDSWYSTVLTGVKAIVDAHGHVYNPGPGAPVISSTPVGAGIAPVPPGVASPLPAWPACQMTSPRGD